jgi:hypothetical protein
VPSGRHRKSVPAQLRLQRWAAVSASVLTAAAAVPVAVALEPEVPARTSVAAHQPARAEAARAAARTVSRELVRTEPPAPRMADVDGLDATAGAVDAVPDPHELSTRWLTASLNVWTEAAPDRRLLTVLDAGGTVKVTGLVRGAWAQVVRGDRVAWVHKAYLARHQVRLARHQPEAGSAGVSGAPCSDGSSVETGLTAHAVAVYRAVCAAFPAVSAWGGRTGSGGDHSLGLALDIMCSGSLGDEISSYVRAHAGELGVSYVIWSQHIWSVERSGEGWRAMPDRGSTTANHYDHVHVTVF